MTKFQCGGVHVSLRHNRLPLTQGHLLGAIQHLGCGLLPEVPALGDYALWDCRKLRHNTVRPHRSLSGATPEKCLPNKWSWRRKGRHPSSSSVGGVDVKTGLQAQLKTDGRLVEELGPHLLQSTVCFCHRV